MSLLTFLTYTDRLDLVGIIDLLVQHIYHVLDFFIHGLAMSLLAVGDGALLEHVKGAYSFVL